MAAEQLTSQKQCSRCGDIKPLSEFQPRKNAPFGVEYSCRECRSEITKLCQRRRRQNSEIVNRERLQQKLTRQTDAYRAKRREYERRQEVKQQRNRYQQSEQGRRNRRAAVNKHRKKKWRENGCRPTGRPAAVPTESLIDAYASGTSYDVASQFDMTPSGVVYRLRRAGVERRGRVSGDTCQCADGHIVRSALERVVDDWLFEHGIEHVVSPRCPWPPKSGRYYSFADFLVGDTYIEVWGLAGIKKYDRRMLQKLNLYSKHQATVINLWPREIQKRDFSKLLPLLGQKILK